MSLQGTEQVNNNIGAVRQGTSETGTAAARVLTAAQELARHSSSLSQQVNAFLVGVKAACYGLAKIIIRSSH